jgi:hypothetical protein
MFPPPLWGRVRERGKRQTPEFAVPPSPALPHKGGESRSERADGLLQNIEKFSSKPAFDFSTLISVIREIGRAGKGLLWRNFPLSIALRVAGVCTSQTDRI